MKIAKPLLIVTTPIGVAGGLYEAHRLAGGLVFLMVAMLLVVSAAIGLLVMTIRREQREERERQRADAAAPPAPPATADRIGEPAVSTALDSARDPGATQAR